MTTGALGDIVFEVSDATIETINNVTWGGSVNYHTHLRHLNDALTEYTGRNPDTMSFEIILSNYLGIDPMSELVKIWTYERNGTAVPLVIGEKIYGKYRWNITKHSAKATVYANDGSVLTWKVSLTLQEYLK